MSLLVLTAEDVLLASSSLTPDALMSLMALVFVRLHFRDRICLPLRISISTDTYSTLFMPARVEGLGTAIKTVSVPGASGRGGVHATTLVLDEQSGAVQAVINATSLTALRTAAGSALATRVLGPSSPRTLLVFGAGRQTEAHVDLFIRVFPSLNRCIIVNRSLNSRLKSLRTCLQNRFGNVMFSSKVASGLNTAACDLEHTVSSADIICTATPSLRPLFRSSWVKKGTHINLVGSYTPAMAEVEVELIRRAGKVLVDSREACLVEAGELIQAKTALENLVEIGEVVGTNGKSIPDAVQVVKEAGDVTIFKSVGVGLQDTAITNAIVEKAISMGLGKEITDYA